MKVAGVREIALYGLTVLTLTAASGGARADVIVGEDGVLKSVERHRALISYSGRAEIIIEELELRSDVRRVLWIKTLPQEPTFSPTDAAFKPLSASTRPLEPFNQTVRRKVFGPSMLTILNERLFPKHGPAEVASDEEEPRALRLVERRVFQGLITTSTTTGQYVAPDEMQTWLTTQGFSLGQPLLADLAAALGHGAHAALTVLEDLAPDSPGLARAGPFRSSISTATAVFPNFRSSLRNGVPNHYELFVLGSTPLLPVGFPVYWDEEAWLGEDHARDQFHITFAQRLPETSTVLSEVERNLDTLPANPFLVHSTIRRRGEPFGDIQFEASDKLMEIPGSNRRGGRGDLLFCVLLGLTPLIYTPESWFLLWLGARGRAAQAQGRPGFGTRLWSLFCLGVALYWALTLQDGARLAAFLPGLVGLLLLFKPRAARENYRVRAQFKKSKTRNSARA